MAYRLRAGCLGGGIRVTAFEDDDDDDNDDALEASESGQQPTSSTPCLAATGPAAPDAKWAGAAAEAPAAKGTPGGRQSSLEHAAAESPRLPLRWQSRVAVLGEDEHEEDATEVAAEDIAAAAIQSGTCSG